MKTKTVILVVCVLLAGGILLPETGVVDCALYRSEFATSQTASTVRVNADADREGLEITMQEPRFSGNLLLPLYKSFTMNYECQVEGRPCEGADAVQGTIKGEVKGKIYGLCSRRIAKELAQEQADKQINRYLWEHAQGG